MASAWCLRVSGLAAGLLWLAGDATVAEDPPRLAESVNPAPEVLPSLWVYENEEELLMVAAHFPKVPDFSCEAWCYESEVNFEGARALDGGRVELRHRDKQYPQVAYVTTVTPEPGAVEFLAKAELDPAKETAWPGALTGLNLCWQLRKAPAFASKPEPYPEFVKRCFIITRDGRKFLDKTVRKPIPCRSAEDPYNNPPWVQMYIATGRPIPAVTPQSWADYSSDQFTVPVIGAVSRDGKYLAAIATRNAGLVCQAWHDCMHGNPEWTPAEARPEERRWRLRVYVMANDVEALRRRIAQDFPPHGH